MITSRSDRSKISTLHGVESSVWKKPATAITVPSNNTNSSPKMNPSSNPFSGIGLNTANVGKAKANNNVKRESMASRMRPKQGRQSEQAFHPNIQKSRTLLASADPKRGPRKSKPFPNLGRQDSPIDLSDDHDISTTAKPPLDLHSQRPIAGPSRIPSPEKQGPRQIQLAKDGIFMQQLNKRVDLSYLPDDDIQSRSPTPPKERDLPPESTKPAPKVWNIVESFEKMAKSSSAPPKEDLRMRVRSKPNSRSQFGPNTALSPVASSSTPSSSSISLKAQGKKRKRNGPSLPLKTIFAANPPRFFNFDGSEGSVTWDGIYLRVLNDPDSEMFRISRINYKKITATFYKPDSRQVLVRFEEPSTISQELPFDLILWFDLDDSEWNEKDYDELFHWLRPHIRTQWNTVGDLMSWAERQVHGPSSPVLEASRRNSVTVSDVDSVSPAEIPHQSKTESSSNNPFSRNAPKRPLLGNVYPSEDPFNTKKGDQVSTSKAVPNTAIPQKAIKAEPTAPLRRSTRQSAGNPSNDALPPGDADEVILVYPPDVPGKVNITKGDVSRLQPGEFLNDTLIEFGLKLWLRELEEKNPELAKQVHVFSSFFYKKLNKRDIAEGYSSVRKWTAKFNLFEKKYIIVPINERMHWYLAIIYEPEHVLSSPEPVITVPPSPSTNHEETTESKPASETHDQGSPLTVDDLDIDHEMTSSECGIEQDLTNLTQACSIGGDADSASEKPHTEEEADIMNVDQPTTTKEKSPTPEDPIIIDGEAPGGAAASSMRHSPELLEIAPHSKDNQNDVASKTPSTNGDEADDLNLVSEDIPVIVEDSLVLDSGIDPSSFYSTGTRSGKQYGKPKPRPVTKPRRSNAQSVPDTQVPNRTYVLTLDSLGTSHKHAARVLSTYLKHEAKDKKGVESQAPIDVRQVHVPTQPNFCDCGVYLLHLAQTFISDTSFFMDQVFSTTAKTPNSVRQTLWLDEKVPLMRESLKKRILELSKDWKQIKSEKPPSKAKDRQPAVVAELSSDSDIDIIEHTVAPSAKGRGKNKQGAAARIR